MIPSIIHYCWFGEGEKSFCAKRCIDSWAILTDMGFELREWNESNFDINAHSVIKWAYQNKLYAFVSDYVRLKVLYEYGGIYLDTDVEVFKDLTPLMNCGLLLGMIYDCSIGTAVIGSNAQHEVIGKLIDCYETSSVPLDTIKSRYFVFKDYEEYTGRLINNNDLFTVFFLENVKRFNLHGKHQQIGDIHIYPKHYFEGEAFNKSKQYTRHYGEGSWYKTAPARGFKQRLKQLLKKDIKITSILWDKFYRYRHNKRLPFYSLRSNGG